MHRGFVIEIFLKTSLTMVGDTYQGEFFMHMSDGSILQKSKRLMTSLKFVIRPLISKLIKSKRYP